MTAVIYHFANKRKNSRLRRTKCNTFICDTFEMGCLKRKTKYWLGNFPKIDISVKWVFCVKMLEPCYVPLLFKTAVIVVVYLKVEKLFFWEFFQNFNFTKSSQLKSLIFFLRIFEGVTWATFWRNTLLRKRNGKIVEKNN